MASYSHSVDRLAAVRSGVLSFEKAISMGLVHPRHERNILRREMLAKSPIRASEIHPASMICACDTCCS